MLLSYVPAARASYSDSEYPVRTYSGYGGYYGSRYHGSSYGSGYYDSGYYAEQGSFLKQLCRVKLQRHVKPP